MNVVDLMALIWRGLLTPTKVPPILLLSLCVGVLLCVGVDLEVSRDSLRLGSDAVRGAAGLWHEILGS